MSQFALNFPEKESAKSDLSIYKVLPKKLHKKFQKIEAENIEKTNARLQSWVKNGFPKVEEIKKWEKRNYGKPRYMKNFRLWHEFCDRREATDGLVPLSAEKIVEWHKRQSERSY